ncbi:hypothetical protein ABWK22_02875 [Gottfriedia acidiceleris]|uniref:hypothetical protein n=1 Tax=Gottfriedia acidiceleris TaxID=371036 RepID=UPI003395D94F
MKVTLEENQTPFENEEYNKGLQFLTSENEVFVQIGKLSIRVDKNELRKVLSVLS